MPLYAYSRIWWPWVASSSASVNVGAVRLAPRGEGSQPPCSTTYDEGVDRSLRIRLEGADETLEQFIADCGAVKALLGPGWRTRLRGNALAAGLARAQARISRARTAC